MPGRYFYIKIRGSRRRGRQRLDMETSLLSEHGEVLRGDVDHGFAAAPKSFLPPVFEINLTSLISMP